MKKQSPGFTPEQYEVLLRPLRPSRVATRKQGGKDLSFLEAWDVRAHLIRVLGFGNFDAEVLDARHLFTRDYGSDDRPMQEIAYQVLFRLTVRNPDGKQVAVYSEASVGSASGGSGFGDLHDNALKSAASDALKRCAINLGTQFGLSLYDNGTKADVVRTTIVKPETPEQDQATGQEAAGDDLTDDQAETLARSLGASDVADAPTGPVAGAKAVTSNVGQVPVEDVELPGGGPHTEAGMDELRDEGGPQFERKADTVEQAKQAVEAMGRRK